MTGILNVIIVYNIGNSIYFKHVNNVYVSISYSVYNLNNQQLMDTTLFNNISMSIEKTKGVNEMVFQYLKEIIDVLMLKVKIIITPKSYFKKLLKIFKKKMF